MTGLSICVFLIFQLLVQVLAEDSDLPACTTDECESIMPGYHDATVYVRPKAQDKYTYIEAETACLDLNATVVVALDKRNRGYLNFAAALKFGINMDVWYFKGPILRSDSSGVPDENVACYALQSKEAPNGSRYAETSPMDCAEKMNAICEMPRRPGACGDWEPAWIFNGSCYKVLTASPLMSFANHQRACDKMQMNTTMTSIHSDEEMRHVLNIFARQLEWDSETVLQNQTDWRYYTAFLGIERRTDNTTLWENTDKTPFDYGDPVGQMGRWPWCSNKPDDLSKDVVRIGPFYTSNASDPVEDPRSYGCWQDEDAMIKVRYAICKRKFDGTETGNARFFYYEPERSPTLPPSSTTPVTASSSQTGSDASGGNGRKNAEPVHQRRPDRHA